LKTLKNTSFSSAGTHNCNRNSTFWWYSNTKATQHLVIQNVQVKLNLSNNTQNTILSNSPPAFKRYQYLNRMISWLTTNIPI